MEFVADFESPNCNDASQRIGHINVLVSMHDDMISLRTSSITALLLPLFRGTIEEVICQIVSQMGTLKDGSPGFASRQLLNIYDLIEDMSSYTPINLVTEAETMDTIRETSSMLMTYFDWIVIYCTQEHRFC